MSTKKLARTPIEGGRIPSYKFERKHSLRTERHFAKSIISIQDDFTEMELPTRKLSSYGPEEKFKDKLGPVYRWLDSKVGKSWDKIYSLMREKFDDRTVPGRHILYSHLLNQIWTSQDRSANEYYSYFVDAQGILRKEPDRYIKYKNDYHKINKERELIGQWLAGRFIGNIGNVLHWFEPARSVPNPIKFGWDYIGPKYTYQRFSLTDKNTWYEWIVPYRQGKRLLGKDVEFFSKLMDCNKEWLLKHSPQHKKLYNEPFGRF